MLSPTSFAFSLDLGYRLGHGCTLSTGRRNRSYIGVGQERTDLETKKVEEMLRMIPNDIQENNELHKTWGKDNNNTASMMIASEASDNKLAPLMKALGASDRSTTMPLVSALKVSAQKDVASFNFPGHNRGQAAPPSLTEVIGAEAYRHDLLEVPGLETLFSPNGPILYAQREAAKLFGCLETWFLVGGTTCGIQAAIMGTCSPGDTMVLARNSHVSATSAMILSGAEPKYVIPQYDCNWDIPGGVTPAQKAIGEAAMDAKRVGAVFITSPTYHGICSDLTNIALICHINGIPLIVDEAHGAHFAFHPLLRPNSALKQGADVVVQSTHKVLCSLTQSSMLHMAGNLVDRDRLHRCLQSLQSTSRSNLLLASLDAARAQLSANPDTVFNDAMDLAIRAKSRIGRIPDISVLDFPQFSNFPAMDPLRITVGFQNLGFSGYEADEIMYRDHGIISELIGTKSVMCPISLGIGEKEIQRFVAAIEHVSSLSSSFIHRKGRFISAPPFAETEMRLNPRDAFFAGKRRVRIDMSEGEVCGELICPFPPGIPAMFPGEIITERALDYLVDLKEKGAKLQGLLTPSSPPSYCAMSREFKPLQWFEFDSCNFIFK